MLGTAVSGHRVKRVVVRSAVRLEPRTFILTETVWYPAELSPSSPFMLKLARQFSIPRRTIIIRTSRLSATTPVSPVEIMV